jgi:hypothetical protein
MNKDKIDQLFFEYETAFDALDMRTIAQHYPDHFISAGPKGTIAQNKKEFLNKADQASAMYKSLGQNSAKIISKKITEISNEYSLVTVHWGVTFQKTGNEVIEFDVSYIIQEIDDKPSIILFITHQDEAEAMKKLGLEPELIS